jgi:hypothetical protein
VAWFATLAGCWLRAGTVAFDLLSWDAVDVSGVVVVAEEGFWLVGMVDDSAGLSKIWSAFSFTFTFLSSMCMIHVDMILCLLQQMFLKTLSEDFGW